MKVCLLVRAYSTNLFGYRDVTLGPVFVVLCIAAIAVGSYAHCVSLYCRMHFTDIQGSTTIPIHQLPTIYLSIRLCLAVVSRAHAHTQSHTHSSKHVEVIFSVFVILI
jgi:hypothetical protein